MQKLDQIPLQDREMLVTVITELKNVFISLIGNNSFEIVYEIIAPEKMVDSSRKCNQYKLMVCGLQAPIRVSHIMHWKKTLKKYVWKIAFDMKAGTQSSSKFIMVYCSLQPLKKDNTLFVSRIRIPQQRSSNEQVNLNNQKELIHSHHSSVKFASSTRSVGENSGGIPTTFIPSVISNSNIASNCHSKTSSFIGDFSLKNKFNEAKTGIRQFVSHVTNNLPTQQDSNRMIFDGYNVDSSYVDTSNNPLAIASRMFNSNAQRSIGLINVNHSSESAIPTFTFPPGSIPNALEVMKEIWEKLDEEEKEKDSTQLSLNKAIPETLKIPQSTRDWLYTLKDNIEILDGLFTGLHLQFHTWHLPNVPNEYILEITNFNFIEDEQILYLLDIGYFANYIKDIIFSPSTESVNIHFVDDNYCHPFQWRCVALANCDISSVSVPTNHIVSGEESKNRKTIYIVQEDKDLKVHQEKLEQKEKELIATEILIQNMKQELKEVTRMFNEQKHKLASPFIMSTLTTEAPQENNRTQCDIKKIFSNHDATIFDTRLMIPKKRNREEAQTVPEEIQKENQEISNPEKKMCVENDPIEEYDNHNQSDMMEMSYGRDDEQRDHTEKPLISTLNSQSTVHYDDNDEYNDNDIDQNPDLQYIRLTLKSMTSMNEDDGVIMAFERLEKYIESMTYTKIVTKSDEEEKNEKLAMMNGWIPRSQTCLRESLSLTIHPNEPRVPIMYIIRQTCNCKSSIALTKEELNQSKDILQITKCSFMVILITSEQDHKHTVHLIPRSVK